MSVSRLTQNVRNKMLVEFDSVQSVSNESSDNADAILCGFILEGDMNDFEALGDATQSSGDWYYSV